MPMRTKHFFPLSPLEKCAVCGTACKYLALSDNVSFSSPSRTILSHSWCVGTIQRIQWLRTEIWGEFPGGPVVRTWGFHHGGLGSIPGQGTKIPQAKWHGQKKKTEIFFKKKEKRNKQNV